MSLINVDYNSLEQSKKYINLGANQCSSIASHISGVRSSIDGRVASRCKGLQSLISFFQNCEKKLGIFYENLDTTIRLIQQLDNHMDSSFRLSELLQQFLLMQQQGLQTGDITVQLKSSEEMLELIDGTLLSLKDELTIQELTLSELKVNLNDRISDLLDKGYTMNDIQSNEQYLKLQKEIEEQTLKQNSLQSDLSKLNNLKIILDYQKKDLEYQVNAKKTSDFLQNNDFENILNEDGTVNKKVMKAINAYRREHNLIEITNEEEFKMIFGETTEEEWLQRAAISYDVFRAVNPMMVASAVNKNGYETSVDIDNYLLADTYLTEQEKQTYNYYYNTQGRASADEYLNFKLGEINTRKTNEENRIHQETYQQYLNLGKNSNYDELSLRYYDRTLNLPEHLTEEEKNAAIYLYKTEGLDKYDEFIDFLDIDLKQREAKNEANQAIEDFANSGIFKNVTIGATGLKDGVNNFFEGLLNATIVGSDEEVSVNQLKSQYILETLMTDERFTPYLDSGTYEISMGIGNMAPSIATSALISSLTANPLLGAKVGTSLMGISSGGNAYENALINGFSQNDALLYGVLSGASEATLGYFLGNIPGLSKADSTTLLGLLKESGEEASQSILDSVLRNQVLGEELVIDFNDVVKSGTYGIITSGILNGGTLVYNGISLKGSDIQNVLNESTFDTSLMNDEDYIKNILNIASQKLTTSNSDLTDRLQEFYVQKKTLSFVNHQMLDNMQKLYPFLNESQIKSLKGSVTILTDEEFQKEFPEKSKDVMGVNHADGSSWLNVSFGTRKGWEPLFGAMKQTGVDIVQMEQDGIKVDFSKVILVNATHESTHKLANMNKTIENGVLKYGFIVQDSNKNIKYNVGLNEAMTEYLAELSIGSENYPIFPYCTYQPAVARIKQLVSTNVLSLDSLKYSYINHRVDYVEDAINTKAGSKYQSKTYKTPFQEFSYLMDHAAKGNSFALADLDKFIVRYLSDYSISLEDTVRVKPTVDLEATIEMKPISENTLSTNIYNSINEEKQIQNFLNQNKISSTLSNDKNYLFGIFNNILGKKETSQENLQDEYVRLEKLGIEFSNHKMLQKFQETFTNVGVSDIEKLKDTVLFQKPEQYDGDRDSIGYNDGTISHINVKSGTKTYWKDFFRGLSDEGTGYFDYEHEPVAILKATASHESIHQLAFLKGEIIDGFKKSAFLEKQNNKVYNLGLTEAVTEYFNKLALGSDYPNSEYCAYQPVVARIQQLVDNNLFSNETMMDAYFNHKPEVIANIINEKMGDKYNKYYSSAFEEFTTIVDQAIMKGTPQYLAQLDKFIIKLFN